MTPSHGFELVREESIPEINSSARLYRHIRTGAQLLAVLNDDENKTFGATFATQPGDHTGVPHIIEHSVLGGSRKYPVKEPFVELVKGSLATFVNAMTTPDSTIYPCASQNLQDFYNLMEIYLDAVFDPQLSRHTFEQEGWHYELQDEQSSLGYRGIVFNEMKGNYATADWVLLMESLKALFPDTVYGKDCGGDPRYIPDLSYEQFKSFYETFYHPANARLYLYGDLPIEESLARIDEHLQRFGHGEAVPPVPLQPRFSAPCSVVAPYMVSDEAERQKAYVVMSWILAENDDPVRDLGLEILEYALIDSPASPLRKVLVDSGLGEDLAGLSLWFEPRQSIFSAGLRGVELESTDQVEPLILQTLAALARDGFEKEMVEAAVNTAEFSLREVADAENQRGLALMERALGSWLHQGDPFRALAFAAPLEQVKANLAANPRYLEGMILEYLLDNPHRVTVLLQPDVALPQRQEEMETDRLERERAAMSVQEIAAVVANTRTLRIFQETPNSPEALATLPVLKRDDLDRKNGTIPIEVGQEAGGRVLYHALPTNGIFYLDLGFDLRLLPQEYLPYVTVLGRALLETGTQKEDFVRLSQHIGRKTGGIHPQLFTSAARQDQTGPVWLFLRGKAMADQGEELLSILRDVLLTARLDNQERFRQIVLEEKARREAELLEMGTRIVNRRLGAHFVETDWVSDQVTALGGLFAVRQLARDVDTAWPSVMAKLEAIRSILVNRAAMLANVTLDSAAWDSLRPGLADFLAELPSSPVVYSRWQRPALPPYEGFSIPAQVNYVGKGANLYRLGYKLHGSALVINRYLDTTWLWDKVRAQGGAYGGMALLNHLSGMFNYLSYRDPNLLVTLDNYDGTADFLRRLELDEAELTKSIIGAIGEMDSYQLPAARGFTSMSRYLTGQTEESRQQLRDEVLATTVAHFKAFAEVLEAVRQQGEVVILGAEEGLCAADRERGHWLAINRAL